MAAAQPVTHLIQYLTSHSDLIAIATSVYSVKRLDQFVSFGAIERYYLVLKLRFFSRLRASSSRAMYNIGRPAKFGVAAISAATVETVTNLGVFNFRRAASSRIQIPDAHLDLAYTFHHRQVF